MHARYTILHIQQRIIIKKAHVEFQSCSKTVGWLIIMSFKILLYSKTDQRTDKGDY